MFSTQICAEFYKLPVGLQVLGEEGAVELLISAGAVEL
jgi:hypothetical protein